MITDHLLALDAALDVPGRRRRRILAEVEDHLLSAAAELHAQGLPAVEAERLAVAHFGDPAALTHQFVRDERARRGARVGLLSVPLALVAGWLGIRGSVVMGVPFPVGAVAFVLAQVGLVAGGLSGARALLLRRRTGPTAELTVLVERGFIAVARLRGAVGGQHRRGGAWARGDAAGDCLGRGWAGGGTGSDGRAHAAGRRSRGGQSGASPRSRHPRRGRARRRATLERAARAVARLAPPPVVLRRSPSRQPPGSPSPQRTRWPRVRRPAVTSGVGCSPASPSRGSRSPRRWLDSRSSAGGSAFVAATATSSCSRPERAAQGPQRAGTASGLRNTSPLTRAGRPGSRRRLGSASSNVATPSPRLEPREVHADADVGSLGEREMPAGVGAAEVVGIGVGEHRRIAVGRRQRYPHELAAPDPRRPQRASAGGVAVDHGRGRLEAQRLLDRGAQRAPAIAGRSRQHGGSLEQVQQRRWRSSPRSSRSRRTAARAAFDSSSLGARSRAGGRVGQQRRRRRGARSPSAADRASSANASVRAAVGARRR